MKALEIAKENGATTVLVTGIGSPLTANKLVLKKIVGHLQYPLHQQSQELFNG
jgi:hypothetical protein